MELANPSYNPVPSDAVCGFATTGDGFRLRYAHWRTVAPPCKGTVLLLHGRAEYIEKLFETVGDLRKKGYDVLTFDWRGQGGSDRLLEDSRRGYVEHFGQYVTDLETIMTDVALPDCRGPFYILAHSTGALVALLAAPHMGNRLRRMVLLAPLLGFGSVPIAKNTLKWLCGTLHVVGLGSLYMAGGATPDENRAFKGNRLTSDLKRFQRNAKLAGEFRDLTIGGPTATWLFAAARAMERVARTEFHSQVTIPTLVICAGNDEVVDNRAAELLCRRLRSGSCLTIPGARHEMLQERDSVREQALAAFYAFAPGGRDQDAYPPATGKAKSAKAGSDQAKPEAAEPEKELSDKAVS